MTGSLDSLMAYVVSGEFKPPKNDSEVDDLLRAANALEDVFLATPDAPPHLVRRKNRFIERVYRATARFVEPD